MAITDFSSTLGVVQHLEQRLPISEIRSRAEQSVDWVGAQMETQNWPRDGIFYLRAHKENYTIAFGTYEQGHKASELEALRQMRFGTQARETIMQLCDRLDAERDAFCAIIGDLMKGRAEDRTAAAARIQGLLEENARLGTDRTSRGDMLEQLIGNVIRSALQPVPSFGGVKAQAEAYRTKLIEQRRQVPS